MTLLDRLLKRVGLMRISQQTIREIEIDADGNCRIDFRNGMRWAGRQHRHYLEHMLYKGVDIDKILNEGGIFG